MGPEQKGGYDEIGNPAHVVVINHVRMNVWINRRVIKLSLHFCTK